MSSLMPRLTLLVVFLASAPALALPISAELQCTTLGGEVVTVSQGTHTSVDLCRLGRGDLTVQTLYNATILHQCTDAVRHFFAPGKIPPCAGNPASCYCSSVGGASSIAQLPSGDELGLCTFADGSQMEEWTLLRGPAGAPELGDALNQASCGN